MKITNDLKAMLNEVKLLEDVDDCFGYVLTGDKTKGIFVQVVNYGEGKEYLIGANNVEEDCFEPCGDYNNSVKFGNYEQFVINIVSCIENQLII